ncbi:MAG: DapH/DapD/GlmU-related protein [Gammaproteobacteria bacterium]
MTVRSTMWIRVRHGLFIAVEKLLRWSIHPRLRARLLKLFGANIGRNVRIYEAQFFNLKNGFRNLHVADDAYIGPRCLLDLEGPLTIGARSTLSPGVTILTHQDPGSSHGIRILELFPARIATTTIGQDCWLGANATVLAGMTLNESVVVGAGSVVTRDVPAQTLVAGVPARPKRSLRTPPAG